VFIVFIKYNVFVELAKGTWEMLVKLWDAFHGIEDREAYDANAEQRKKDEEYKKQMKKKK
jgi:head-tail adaptor